MGDKWQAPDWWKVLIAITFVFSFLNLAVWAGLIFAVIEYGIPAIQDLSDSANNNNNNNDNNDN